MYIHMCMYIYIYTYVYIYMHMYICVYIPVQENIPTCLLLVYSVFTIPAAAWIPKGINRAAAVFSCREGPFRLRVSISS